MRVLVTGANGFIGRAACELLSSRGHEVIAGVRTPSTHSRSTRQWVEERELGDLSARADHSSLMVEVDAVVHLAARVHVMRGSSDDEDRFRRVNVEATRRLAADAGEAGVRRFVFVSSVKVHGERTPDRPFREQDELQPQGAYARSKRDAEVLLKETASEHGIEVVTVRPPLVYGPGVGANFLMLMRLVARGAPLPLAGTTNRRSMIYVTNLAALLELALVTPDVGGEAFLASDGEALTPDTLVRRLAAAMDVRPRLLPAPVGPLRLLGRVGDGVRRLMPFPIGSAEIGRLYDPLQVDTSKARRLLRYRPVVDVDTALRQTVASFGVEGLRS